MTIARERGGVRARESRRAAGRDLAARRASAPSVDALHLGGARRSSSPAASSSVSASHPRSRWSRSCCSSTSRRRSSIPKAPRSSSTPSNGSARPSCSPSTGRPALELATRVLFVDEGRLLLDAPRAEALEWLAAERPAYVETLCFLKHERLRRRRPARPRRVFLLSRGHARPGRGRPGAAAGRDRRARGVERVREDDARPDRRRPSRAAIRQRRAARSRLLPVPGSGPLPGQGDGARRGRACRERG